MLVRRHLLALVPAVLLAAVAAPVAGTPSLDSLRAQGVIAERYDGYVEIRVDDPPSGAKQVVDQVNAKRRQIYQERAKNQGVAPEAVGKVYAEQIVERAPDGTYFKKPDGSYVQK
ncbi:hypothetical protein SAMN05216241_102302 [Limimonas halophila]|uniref:DUF1318 domain-containing protein n=1 Tax=Limimonas halophila TaxID=1082479 RepID=A0A1G7NTF2_9PROT|nr:YdbL family protein [Limimonas halophila]SDF77335.1 hypothetical protein SAMN05216241_102302 [Limimonas halophila]